MAEAKKYKSKSDARLSPQAYGAASRLGILRQITKKWSQNSTLRGTGMAELLKALNDCYRFPASASDAEILYYKLLNGIGELKTLK